MKRFLWLAVLMLTVLGTIAFAAEYGEGSKPFNWRPTLTGGIYGPDSTVHSFKMTSEGYLQTSDPNPFYDMNVENLLITNSALLAGAADSCAPFDNHRNGLGMLAIKVAPTWAATTEARFAVQIRYHYLGGSDTSSVFPIYPINRAATSAVQADSLGQLFVGSASLAWPSEFYFKVNRAQSFSALVGAYPSTTFAFALPQYYGLGVCPTYISVRIRNLTGPTSKVDVYYTSAP